MYQKFHIKVIHEHTWSFPPDSSWPPSGLKARQVTPPLWLLSSDWGSWMAISERWLSNHRAIVQSSKSTEIMKSINKKICYFWCCVLSLYHWPEAVAKYVAFCANAKMLPRWVLYDPITFRVPSVPFSLLFLFKTPTHLSLLPTTNNSGSPSSWSILTHIMHKIETSRTSGVLVISPVSAMGKPSHQ